MSGFIKYALPNGEIWVVEAETDPKRVTDMLLDQYNNAKTESEKAFILSCLKEQEINPKLSIVKKNAQRFKYNPELHGE